MRERIARLALGVAAGASVLMAGVMTPAGAATAPSWQVSENVGTASVPWVTHFNVSGAENAWSAWTAGTGSAVKAFAVERWTGKRWIKVPVPASLVPAAAANVAVGGSSATNAWLIDGPDGTTTVARVLRWNGHQWSTWSIPAWAVNWDSAHKYNIVPFFFSANDVWIFSTGSGTRDNPGVVAGYYNGHRWKQIGLPGIVNQVSAVSANDIWAFGAGGHPTSRTSSYALMHWNGIRWSYVQVPKTVLINQSYFKHIVALGRDSVWLDLDNTFGEPAPTTLRMEHWNGKSWSTVTTPARISYVDGMTQDGHGGLWVTGYGPKPADQYFLAHYSGGKWTTSTLPTDAGDQAGTVTGISWIPGTRSVWATANYKTSSGNTGAILKYP